MRSAATPKGLVLLGLIILCFPGKVSADREAFTVTRIDVRTKYASPPPAAYLPLLPLEEGQQTTPEQIRVIEQTLEKSGLFRSVSVRMVDEPAGTSVLFDLWQMEHVARIDIKRSWFVLSSSIYRVLSMQEGDPFDEEALPDEAERIRSLYEKKGWFETVVVPSYEQDLDDGSIRIRYRIQRGHHTRFGRIELEGVENGDPEQIREILRIWPWVTSKRLDRRIEKVRMYYQRLGYPAARVQVEALGPDSEKGKTYLRVRIQEGKKLVVDVKGNEALATRRILGATTFFKNKGCGLFDAEDSAEAIDRLYEKKGFPDARVTFKRKQEDTDIAVAFSIVEGERAFLQEIRFQGNQTLPEKTLQEQMLTRPRSLLRFRMGKFLTDRWTKDLDSITNLYISEGFLDVETEYSLEPVQGKEDRVLLLVRIREGPRYTIAQCTIEGATPEREAPLEEGTLLRPGQPFHEGRLAEETQRIVEFYAKRGYLRARAEWDYQVREDHTVAVAYKIDEGPCFRLSGLFVTGNRKTRSNTIRNAFQLSAGEPIDGQELAKTRRRLSRLGTFEGLSIKVPGLDVAGGAPGEGSQEETKRPVLIEVRERRSLGVEVGISYDTDWGPEGLLSLREENLLGTARKVTFDIKGGGEKTEAELSFADPTLMAQQATATAQVKYERRELASYTEQRFSFEGGVFRQFREYYTPGLFLLLDWADIYDVVSNAPDAPAPSTTYDLFVRPQIVIDTRHDKLYPTDGAYGEMRFAVSNETWGSDDDLFISEFRLQDYYEVVPRLTLASRIWLDEVTPYGRTDEVPSTYLLFCGGNNTVRGFPKDGLGPKDSNGVPKGGTTRILGNVEVRFPIYRLINGVAFVDVGSLTEGFERIGFETFRWSVGGGARLHTPVGPIRLEYGYQLQPNPPMDRGEFHFALGFPF